jgi:hypothetical protein
VRLFGAAAALSCVLFVLPAAVYPSPQEKLGALLDGRGVRWEEGLLFSGDLEFSGDAAGGVLMPAAGDGRSVLVTFGGNSGEAEEESGPCTALALPLGDEGREDAFDRQCALALIDRLSGGGGMDAGGGAALPARVRVIVAFLGAEDLRLLQSGGEYMPGPLPYLPDPEQTTLWFFDMAEAPAGLMVHHGGGIDAGGGGMSAGIAPLGVVRTLSVLCESLRIPLSFANPFNELYLSGLVRGPAALDFILRQEIGAVFVTGTDRQIPRRSPLYGRIINADNMAELFFRLVSAPPPASIPLPPDRGAGLEYRYRIVSYPGGAFYLSERMLIILFLAAGVLFFVLSQMLFRVRGLFYFRLRIFSRCFWIIPVLYVILVLALGASGLVMSLAGTFMRGNALFSGLILPWLRPALGVGFFALLSLPLRGYRIPRKADFYGAGALLPAALTVLAAAFVNIVLVPVAIETLIILFAGACFRRSGSVFACAFLAPLHGLFMLVFAFLQNGGAGAGPFLLSTAAADTLRMGLAMLPFILMYRRGAALRRRAEPKT